MTLVITGPLIARKNALELPELPNHAEYSEAPPTLRINSKICAGGLLITVRVANKLFERLDMEGNLELQASIVLFASALGAEHKVAHLPARGFAQQCLSEAKLRELANVAQDVGILHRMNAEIQALTNGNDLCQQKSEAIRREAATLSLLVEEYVSSISVSRYLTISKAGTVEVLRVRISDHGVGSGVMNILLCDSCH